MNDSSLSDMQIRLLATIFERGAAAGSPALSRWIGRPVRMSVSSVELVELGELSGRLGPDDATVAVCSMSFAGRLDGMVLLVFHGDSGLALVDLLLRRPEGTTVEWSELERSAACETANIVGCAYLNALAAHLPRGSGESVETLIPSPPHFRHEFAGSLLEFALMEQALVLERVLLIESRFEAEGTKLDLTLLFAPSAEGLDALARLDPRDIGTI
ncbi:MAG: chemotaxis protein CheC [Isosphaeraceae bacterium]|nr:chemotaxis protein CheC [Isosphaeraceae bacterium]